MKWVRFVKEGTKREEVLKNVEYVDSIVMSILKSEMETNPIFTVKNLKEFYSEEYAQNDKVTV